jgi:hypothetical protein
LALEPTENRIMLLLGGILLALACLIIAYYAIAVPVENSFGERYVTSELPLIFPFYPIATFKPITVITYFVFAGVVLVLEGCRDRLRKLELRGARLLLVFVAFGSGYELLWNFFAWFSSWQKTGGVLDLTANGTHAHIFLPANFNFATKIVFLVFALSLYGSLFLQNLEQRRIVNR